MTERPLTEHIADLLAPVVTDAGLELVDVELAGKILRVFLDRPGGIDIEALGSATKLVSAALDGKDSELGGLARDRWILEVSSPGVERRLRTPEQFQRFVGSEIAVRKVPGVDGPRRSEGTLTAADADGIVVGEQAIPYSDIQRARTKFAWPPASGSSSRRNDSNPEPGKATVGP